VYNFHSDIQLSVHVLNVSLYTFISSYIEFDYQYHKRIKE